MLKIKMLWIISIFIFSACKLKDPKEFSEQGNRTLSPGESILISQGMRWSKISIPFGQKDASFGGMDVTVDQEGFIHAVTLMSLYDDNEFRYNFKLMYFSNRNGGWQGWELKNQQTLFYNLQNINGRNSFIELHVSSRGETKILYLDSSKNLQLISFVSNTASKKILLSNVSSFNSYFDTSSDELHLAIMDNGETSRTVSYFHYDSDSFVINSKRYAGGFDHQIDPSHLQIFLHQNRPVILFNAYSNTIRRGRFLMIYDEKIYILVNGTDYRSLFNAIKTNEGFKTCYMNAYDKSFELSINLSPISSSQTEANYIFSNSLRHNCFISSDTQMPYIRYQNLNRYNHQLDFYNWKSRSQATFEGINFHEIRVLKLVMGKIFIAGQDADTGAPTLYIKH